MSKQYILAVKVNGVWRSEGLKEFSPSDLDKIWTQVEEENGPDTFRAFRIEDNKAMKFPVTR